MNQRSDSNCLTTRQELFPGLADPPAVLDRENGYTDYGLLRLAGGAELGCVISGLLGEHKDESDNDWLVLAILRGMQMRTFDVVWSDHFRQDNPWLDWLDAAYLAIAEAVYAVAPFAFAVIDHEGLCLVKVSRRLSMHNSVSVGCSSRPISSLDLVFLARGLRGAPACVGYHLARREDQSPG